MGSRDYWDVATVLEVAALGEDWELAWRAARRLLVLDAAGWMRESTVANLRLIRIHGTWAGRGLPPGPLDGLIEQLAAGGFAPA